MKDAVAIFIRGKHYRHHKVHHARTYENCPGVRARYSWGEAGEYAPFSLQDARPDAYLCGFCFPGWAGCTVAEYLDYRSWRERKAA